MPSISSGNLFDRQNHNIQAVWTYKAMTLFSWLLNVLVSLYYTVGMPDRAKEEGAKTIWMINEGYQTLFSLSPLVTTIYWLFLFALQIAYIYHLFSPFKEDVQAAVGVGSHFIFSNIAMLCFIFLFIEEHFLWAELLLIINFCNLMILYFGHNTYPRIIHVPITAGPLAWAFVALFWNGAFAIHPHDILAHVLAFLSTWAILIFGWFFLLLFQDYTTSFALSILCLSLGVEQLLIGNNVSQWISAFAIMTLLFISTLVIGIPALFGKELILRREQSVVAEDLERAPLLEDILEQTGENPTS